MRNPGSEANHGSKNRVSSAAKTAGKIALVLTSGVGIGTGIGISISSPDLAADAYHAASGNTTPIEEAISHAVKKGMGVDMRVRCAPIPDYRDSEEMTVRAYTHSAPLAGSVSLVRIRKDICNDAMVVAGHETNLPPEKFDNAARAIKTITHEAEHVLRDPRTVEGMPDEATTDCYAFQDMITVAEALGASNSLAQQLTFRGIRLAAHYSPPSYITSPDTCRNGGALDLHPDPVAPAYFPVPS